MLARRTWRYFDDFLGPDDNWLPPDNFQNYPAPMLASRTSPTNIGMGFLAYQAANDFGYLSAGDFLRRVEATFASLDKLERYRGHFYNWYDTRTLQPLRPQYVSSVDSGTFVGSLVTLRAGLMELKEQPVLPPQVYAGLADTLRVVSQVAKHSGAPALAQSIAALQARVEPLVSATPTTTAASLEAAYWFARVSEALRSARAAAVFYLRNWVEALWRQVRAHGDDLASLT